MAYGHVSTEKHVQKFAANLRSINAAITVISVIIIDDFNSTILIRI